MARDRGWFRVERDIADDILHECGVFAFALWVCLKSRAAWEPVVTRGPRAVALDRGECIVSLSGLADDLKVTREKVRRALTALERRGYIVTRTLSAHSSAHSSAQSSAHSSAHSNAPLPRIVTVCGYDSYAERERISAQHAHSVAHSHEHTDSSTRERGSAQKEQGTTNDLERERAAAEKKAAPTDDGGAELQTVLDLFQPSKAPERTEVAAWLEAHDGDVGHVVALIEPWVAKGKAWQYCRAVVHDADNKKSTTVVTMRGRRSRSETSTTVGQSVDGASAELNRRFCELRDWIDVTRGDANRPPDFDAYLVWLKTERDGELLSDGERLNTIEVYRSEQQRRSA